jgi:hypothetical protein
MTDHGRVGSRKVKDQTIPGLDQERRGPDQRRGWKQGGEEIKTMAGLDQESRGPDHGRVGSRRV